MLKNPLTYEIMTPESVGLKNTNLVLGKHSGRAAFNDRMQELGFDLGKYSTHNTPSARCYPRQLDHRGMLTERLVVGVFRCGSVEGGFL